MTNRVAIGLVLALGLAACRSAPESPPPTDTRLQRGIDAIEGGRASEGIELLEGALTGGALTDAERLTAHRFAGHAWTLERDPERALEHYERGIALDPVDPWLRYATGVALREVGANERAEASFSSAIELDPSHLKALQFRAELRMARSDYEAAKADLDRTLALIDAAEPATLRAWGGDPSELRRWTLHRRALCHGMLGDRDAARRDEEAATALAAGP
ncbi:MAG: hypothetical protein AAF682_19210 [Planctomycetota bacterium]